VKKKGGKEFWQVTLEDTEKRESEKGKGESFPSRAVSRGKRGRKKEFFLLLIVLEQGKKWGG